MARGVVSRHVLSVVLLAVLGALAVTLMAMQSSSGAGRGGPLGEAASRSAQLRAVVTIAPLKGILEPLLPRGSTVTVLMPPGRSEHNYEFTPADMAGLGRSDVAFLVGLELEPAVEKFVQAHPSEARADLVLADLLEIKADGSHEHHDHTHTEACDHGPVDPHLWVDPALVKRATPKIAERVRDLLKRRGALTPELEKELREAEKSHLASIEALDAEIRAGLEPLRGRKMVTHHAAFGRLAERYGLVVLDVIKGFDGAEPTPGRLASIVERIKSEGVSAIFIEPQYNPASAKRLAEAANVRVAMLDPLGTGDWFAMMRSNTESLVSGLSSP